MLKQIISSFTLILVAVSCLPQSTYVYILVPVYIRELPELQRKEFTIASKLMSVPKNEQSRDPWYCSEDNWRLDPGFELTLTPKLSDDPFYTNGKIVLPNPYLDSGLELRILGNWRTDSGL